MSGGGPAGRLAADRAGTPAGRGTAMIVNDSASDEVVGICFHGIGVPGPGLEPEADEYFVSRDLFLAVLDERHGAPGGRLDVR